MQLVLVRHGKPDTSLTDHMSDPPLSEDGRRQAHGVAARLVKEGIDQIFSSPMARATATAHVLAEQIDLPITTLDGLAEADRRAMRYVAVEQLRENQEIWQRFLQDPVSFLGGDPVSFRRDVLEAFDHILAARQAKKVAVFTHGLPINVLLGHALGLQSMTGFVPHYCFISRLVGISLEALTIISVNETGHFEPGE
ncbi:MAG: histidine phosphatase family protein [Chloroflexota bacterium]|nr:histidine phosphatase family protein [Chloroflexota bacterium]